MKQTKTMLRLELEVKPEMAAKCHLAAMAPMTVMVTGRRSILLASRQMSAAAVLDTLVMLKTHRKHCWRRSKKPAEAAIRSVKRKQRRMKVRRKPPCRKFRQNCSRAFAQETSACASSRGIS